jgi:hypothetical protein
MEITMFFGEIPFASVSGLISGCEERKIEEGGDNATRRII